MNKEDIWVSRVALAAEVPAWNIYAPKWAPVTVSGDEIRLEDRDPYDYASATRVFKEQHNVNVSFDLLAEQLNAPLHIELLRPSSPLRMAVTPTIANEWKPIRIAADLLQRIVFRTAEPRGIGGANPVPPGSDRPHSPFAFRIRNLRLSSKTS
jgi:hypothetical protein